MITHSTIDHLALCGYIRGNFKRRLMSKIEADVRAGGNRRDGAARVFRFCEATRERWPAMEPMLAESVWNTTYARHILNMKYPICDYWVSYMIWVGDGRPATTAYMTKIFTETDEHMRSLG